MKKRINFIVGDYCDDGHGKYEKILVEISYERSSKYYKKDALRYIAEMEKTHIPAKFNIYPENWCTEYEECCLSVKDTRILKELLDIIYPSNETDCYTIYDSKQFMNLIFKLIKKIDPTFDYKFVELPEYCFEGGYGIFY